MAYINGKPILFAANITQGAVAGNHECEVSAEEFAAVANRVKALEESGSAHTNVFVGTRDEYNTANNAGKIPDGMVVFLLDEADSTTVAILGQAILGQMILGNGG